jgi:hypothetical protein
MFYNPDAVVGDSSGRWKETAGYFLQSLMEQAELGEVD